jgi:hypothetical protein
MRSAVVHQTEARPVLLATSALLRLPVGTALKTMTFEVGSRGRARTYNHTVNSRVLYH